MNEKKVIVVIVEGPSDENALGEMMKEFFSSKEVQFAVAHGDITSDSGTTVDNALKKVNALIENIKSKYGYRWKDFTRVIHIADTDGAFTKGCIKEAEVEGVQYYTDRIEISHMESIESRNKHKSEIMSKLYSSGKVHDIQYRLYFNSCNLEHVLYNELKDFSDDEKEMLADEFAEKYDEKVEDFITFISDESLAVPGSYKATWKYIEKDKNSLQRHSNMHLIFS